MKILIVEDDPQVARLLSRLLANEGCEVRATGSAEEAIRLAGLECFQLIITDINLPGMNGFEAIYGLKRAGGAPILVMTGHADEEFALDARMLGAIGLIAKPFESEVLRGFLRDLSPHEVSGGMPV
jgi:DNA-binding response OmpR family regulator